MSNTIPPDMEKFPRYLYFIIGLISILFLVIIAFTLFTSCTITQTMIDRTGSASDIVDEVNETKPTVTIPFKLPGM